MLRQQRGWIFVVKGKPTLAAVPEHGVTLRSAGGAAVLAATVLSSLVAFVDANLVNVAVPAIGDALSAGVVELQWIVTGYLVTVAAFLLVAGALADALGRRLILLIGLSIMLVASVACAVAPDAGILIAARLIQGLGGALVVPTSLALLGATLRVEDRARGIGIWAGIATLGTTVGPYVGGWLVDHANWRWVFLLNVPLVLAAVLVLRAPLALAAQLIPLFRPVGMLRAHRASDEATVACGRRRPSHLSGCSITAPMTPRVLLRAGQGSDGTVR